jgi:N-dimethylarginine dimethylaminohydrolase
VGPSLGNLVALIAGTYSEVSTIDAEREQVPFRLVTADGDAFEFAYSSPRKAAEHDEMAVIRDLPWFESGRALKNWVLHDTDMYDEVEQVWGRRWGAEGIGRLREVLVSRPTENEIRKEYAQEWQYYYSTTAENADLGKMQAEFDEYYETLENHGVRVHYIEPPVPAIGAYGYLKNLVTLAGGGLVVRGGAIVHRMGLGSWQRGREVIWSKILTSLQIPIYLTVHGRGIAEVGAGRWLDSQTFVFNNSTVGNEEGLRQVEFVLENLGIEFIKTFSPGWVDHHEGGKVGTQHADMFLLVPDERVCVLAPHLVDYEFVRELFRRGFDVVEVPVDEYWDLATNGITLEPGKILTNVGSPTVVKELERRDIEVLQLGFSESHRFALAGLHCATLELVRDQPGSSVGTEEPRRQLPDAGG